MTDFWEVMLRGAVVGILLLLAVKHLSHPGGKIVGRLGALFFLSISAYAVISLPIAASVIEPVRPAFVTAAAYAIVFFWWFILAILQNTDNWRHWQGIPFLLVTILVVMRFTSPDLLDENTYHLFHQLISIAIIGNIFWLCVMERNDDLLESRRLLRLIFVVLTSLFGSAIIAGELIVGTDAPPEMVVHLLSMALFGAVFLYAALSLRLTDLFDVDDIPKKETLESTAIDNKHHAALMTAMNEGAYLETGLTIRKLAVQTNVPEHRLRYLINKELGFKNFSSFLNKHRIADAKAILSDPALAEKQVLLIALDLGYGSIGPFNRAFKTDTGMTPSAFRQKILVHPGQIR